MRHSNQIFCLSLFLLLLSSCKAVDATKSEIVIDKTEDKKQTSSGSSQGTGTGEQGTYGTESLYSADGGQISDPHWVPPTESVTPTPTPVASVTPIPVPTPVLKCQYDRIALNPGQISEIEWVVEDPTENLPNVAFSLASNEANVSWGSLSHPESLKVKYHAPPQVLEEFEVQVTATPVSNEFPSFVATACTIRLSRGGDLGVPDDGITRGLVGNVYDIGTVVYSLPDFDLMTPVQTLVTSNLDIPVRAFTEGFPGVRDLFEWFGIQFKGRIIVPEAHEYVFRVTADDGAILRIDNAIIVNNDGVHAPASRDGSVYLTAGLHDFQVDYFQGPRYHIALQLFWKQAGSQDFVIIPPDSFRRPRE